MKMKKSIAFVLLVVMLLTCFAGVCPAMADKADKPLALYTDEATNTLSFAGTGYGEIVGIKQGDMGKEDSYVLLKSNQDADTSGAANRIELRYNKFSNTDGYRYLVMSAELKPETDSSFTELEWNTNDNALLSHSDDSLVMNEISSGRWNQYTVVYDFGGESKSSTAYVNGKAVASINASTNNFGDLSTIQNARIQLRMACSADSKIGVDNVHIYFTDTAPTLSEPALVSSDKYSVSGETFSFTDGIAVGDLSANADISVYSSIECINKLSANQKLSSGNELVLRSSSGYKYMTAFDKAVESYLFLDGSELVNVPATNTSNVLAKINSPVLSAVQGKNGKKATDTSMLLSRNGTGYLLYTFPAAITSGYGVVEFNADTMGAKIEIHNNNSHATVAVAPADDFLADRWNKCVFVYDSAKKTNTLYVNGKTVAYSENTTAETYGQYLQFRIVSSGDYYIDDFKAYTTATKPEISVPALTAAADCLIDGDSFVAYKKITPNDLAAADGSAVTVYDTATYDYEVIGSNPMYTGNRIVLEDGRNTYTYYDVECYNANVPTVKNTADTLTASAYLMESTLILACYDESGALEAVDFVSGSGAKSLSLTGDYDRAAAMVVNSFEGMTPLAACSEWVRTPTIACWGASLTRGQGASDELTASYPGVLQEISGYNVYNMGVGGETAMTVASRQGALSILLEEAVTIPESGSVEISFKADNGGIVTPRATNVGMWNPCYINGVEGTLSVVVNTDVWPRVLKSANFTRKVSGEAVECAAGDELVVEAQKIAPSADINIIELGSNGGWTVENLQNHTTDEQRTALAELGVKMAENCKNPDKTYIISLSSLTAEQREPLDTILKSYFGDRYIEVGAYLQSKQALTDAGIEPLDIDLEYIAAGKVPPSLLNDKEDVINGVSGADATHLNDYGYRVKAQYIYNRLVELGVLSH